MAMGLPLAKRQPARNLSPKRLLNQRQRPAKRRPERWSHSWEVEANRHQACLSSVAWSSYFNLTDGANPLSYTILHEESLLLFFDRNQNADN